MFITLDTIGFPTSYKQAAQEPCWQDAMNEELLALESNHTWEWVTPRASASIIGRKWVYTIKVKSDGSLDRYKARLLLPKVSNRSMRLITMKRLPQ